MILQMHSDLTLVTGATGLVGNNVVRALLETGQAVRVLVRETYDRRTLQGLDVEIVHGDIRQEQSVRQACQGVARVIHSAGYVQIGRTRMDLHRAINVEGTRHVARAAGEVGARMIHVSSCDALGECSLDEPTDEETPLGRLVKVPYVLTKRESERVILQQVAKGLDAVIVNPGFMLGPWDWKPSSGQMLLSVVRGNAFFAPRGRFSLCDVRDVADGILAALERGTTGQRYILTGQTMSYLDGWRLFSEVCGGRSPVCRAGPLMVLVAGMFGDLRGHLMGKEPEVNSGAMAMSGLIRNYSSARAQKELGYKIRPAKQSVQDAWSWFREYRYA